MNVANMTDVAYADAPSKLRFLVFNLRTYDSKNAFGLGDLLTVMGYNTFCRFFKEIMNDVAHIRTVYNECLGKYLLDVEIPLQSYCK